MPKLYVMFELEVDTMRHVEEAKASLARLSGYTYKGTELLVRAGRIQLTQKMAERLTHPNYPPREGAEVPGLLDGV